MEGNAAQAARNMLRQLMEERRWRVPQVAEALGLSVDIVRRWIQGKSRMQLDDMVAVAKLTGHDLNEVFGVHPKDSVIESDLEVMIEHKVQEALGKLLLGMVAKTHMPSSAGEGITEASQRALDKVREVPAASRRRSAR